MFSIEQDMKVPKGGEGRGGEGRDADYRYSSNYSLT
jgi:hypothetical protein